MLERRVQEKIAGRELDSPICENFAISCFLSTIGLLPGEFLRFLPPPKSHRGESVGLPPPSAPVGSRSPARARWLTPTLCSCSPLLLPATANVP